MYQKDTVSKSIPEELIKKYHVRDYVNNEAAGEIWNITGGAPVGRIALPLPISDLNMDEIPKIVSMPIIEIEFLRTPHNQLRWRIKSHNLS